MTDWMPVMKAVVESSDQWTSWGLAVAAGSVLGIASTSYRRPTQLLWRLPYLLFVPGWIFLGASMYCGTRVSGIYLAALHISDDKHREAALLMNSAFLHQQQTLLGALGVFAIWLLIYTFAWTFVDVLEPIEEKK